MREWLKQKRKEAGLTCGQMATRLGVSEIYYQFIESNRRQKNMDVGMAIRLAEALNLDPMQVIRWEIS